VKPAGAVTAPGISLKEVCFTSGSTRRQARVMSRAGHQLERQQHRVLLAAAEEGARRAVGLDLLGHPRVRHDRETLPHEERRAVRERAERHVSADISSPATPLPRCARSTTSERTSATSGDSFISSAHAMMRPASSMTTNRSACVSSSFSDRGSRCPSTRCDSISACSAGASAALALRMM
jgi:hypothetical protein